MNADSTESSTRPAEPEAFGTVEGRFVCEHCFNAQDEAKGCQECEESALVDTASSNEREKFVERLGDIAAGRRKKYYLGMQIVAVVLCFGLLVVSMAVGRALGGTALEWAAKLFSVGVLAVCWKAIPLIYHRYLLDRPGRLLVRLHREGGGGDEKILPTH